jgi:hypothetical protein
LLSLNKNQVRQGFDGIYGNRMPSIEWMVARVQTDVKEFAVGLIKLCRLRFDAILEGDSWH